MNSIRTAAQRAKLKPRNEPYWLKLGLGQAIGFRRPVVGQPSWKARLHLRDEYRHATFPGTLEFAEALKLGQEFFAASGHGGCGMDTVADAAASYAKIRPATASWHKRLIHADPIADIALAKLAPVDVRDWAERHDSDVVGTANRRKAVLISVLRHALDERAIGSDWPWRQALKHEKETARRSPISDVQMTALRAHLGPLLPLVEFLAVCPLRVGAAVALEVADLQGDQLAIRKDKAGAGRVVTLAGKALDLLRKQSKNKLPKTKVFDVQGPAHVAFRVAVQAAGLPAGVVLYSLRHRAISDMLARGVPALTVAKIAGTSLARIDSNYGHDTATAQRKAFM